MSKPNPYKNISEAAQSVLADINFDGINDGIATADGVLKYTSPYWRIANTLGLIGSTQDVLSDAATAKLDAQEHIDNTYNTIGTNSEVTMHMQNRPKEEINAFTNNLRKDLDIQKNQHIWNSIKGSVTNTPTDGVDAMYRTVPNLGPESAYIDGLTTQNLSMSGFDPRNVFVKEGFRPEKEAQIYIHEDDHSRFPKEGLLKASRPIKVMENIDPSYHGLNTEVSARLAELEAIDAKLSVDKRMSGREFDERKRLLQEVNPFIKAYTEENPKDKRVEYYNKWKHLLKKRK